MHQYTTAQETITAPLTHPVTTTLSVRTRARVCACRRYSHSYGEASRCLAPCNPVRLGIALNFAIFQYEVLGEKVRAGELAWSALHGACFTGLHCATVLRYCCAVLY
eukprot:COSAG05_NODE_1884_length_3893_cov_3.355825_4_plen_107_part_00